MRANTDDWSALGMHANHSGPMLVEGKFDVERMIGPAGDGSKVSYILISRPDSDGSST